jgi:nitrogen regulatory protein PII
MMKKIEAIIKPFKLDEVKRGSARKRASRAYL